VQKLIDGELERVLDPDARLDASNIPGTVASLALSLSLSLALSHSQSLHLCLFHSLGCVLHVGDAVLQKVSGMVEFILGNKYTLSPPSPHLSFLSFLSFSFVTIFLRSPLSDVQQVMFYDEELQYYAEVLSTWPLSPCTLTLANSLGVRREKRSHYLIQREREIR
jgi:hypothetical protein